MLSRQDLIGLVNLKASTLRSFPKLKGARFSLTVGEMVVFKKLIFRVVRRKRFFRLYAKRSLKRALAYASIGFVSGYTVGLQTTQALSVALLTGSISAVGYFIYQLLK
jgi:hypothetical protein